MYKDLFNKKKQKLMKLLARVFGVFLLISLILTLYFWLTKNDFLIGQGLISMLLVCIWFIPTAWYANSHWAQRLKEYVDEHPSNDPISKIICSYLNGDLEGLFKKAGFPKFFYKVNVDKYRNTEFEFSTILGEKQFVVEFERNTWKWFAGDSKIDEQDLQDDEWNYFDISNQDVNSIEDIVAIMKRLYDSSGIHEKMIS